MSTIDVTAVTIRENHEPLVLLDSTEFDLKPQYFKQRLTPDESVWLRETAVEKLRAVKAQLPAGWNIRIWDGWRSRAVQQALYDSFVGKISEKNPGWDEAAVAAEAKKYVHPPRLVGSPPAHVTGGAVDMTFVNEAGEQQNFGTNFDDFSERAHADYFSHHTPQSKEETVAMQNRAQLYYLMGEADFVGDPHEWWHWNYGTAEWAAVKGIEMARYGATEPGK